MNKFHQNLAMRLFNILTGLMVTIRLYFIDIGIKLVEIYFFDLPNVKIFTAFLKNKTIL